MKILVFFFLSLLCFPALAQEHPCADALFRYWEYRDRLLKHFIQIDYWGNGIGVWDDDNKRYTKAGYSLPATQLFVLPSACNYWEYKYGCYSPENFWPDCNRPNVLNFGDSPITLGYYMALLATEYELLSRNGQHEQKEKTLREIWLSLQAYRRLDMTANRFYDKWIELNRPECRVNQNVGACGDVFTVPRFDGYSGFFLRDDVPHFFRNLFNANADGDKGWEVGGIVSAYACTQDDLIEYFFPGNGKAGNNYLSQDNMIGVLFGLAFIKRYVPETVEYGGVNILGVVKKIASGMLNHIRPATEGFELYRSIRYPGCLNDIVVKRGGNVSNYFLAINWAIAYINDEAIVCTDGVDNQKWKAIGSRSCDCGIPFYENCGFNCRMFLELLAVSDNGNFNKIQDKANAVKKDGLILARYLLQQEKYSVNDIKYSIFLTTKDLLCHNPPSCHGPCYQGEMTNEPFYECTNQKGWCSHNRFISANLDKVDCQYGYNENLRGNGIDYMLTHNLFLLTYFPQAPFFNPDAPENEVCFLLPNIFLGEKSICNLDSTMLGIPLEIHSFDKIEWGASQNLTFQLTDESKSSIYVKAKNQQDSVGWVRVKINRNKCDNIYSWSKIWIGPLPVPYIEDKSHNCSHAVCLKNDHAEIFNIEWQVVNWDTANFDLTQAGECASFEFFSPPPVSVDFKVSLINSCETKSTFDTVIFDCDENLKKSIFVYPNPANDYIIIKFQNLSPHIPYNHPVEVRIYDRLSRFMLSQVTGKNTAVIDISGLGNGLYFAYALIDKEVLVTKFVK